jgi:hypothetical protein
MTHTNEALKLALEALEIMTQPVKTNDETTKYKAVTKAITAIKQALAAQPAPVQEPVAWRWVNPKGWLTYGEAPHDTFKSTPLYTTPPAAQRQWVGLTDEDFKYATAGGAADARKWEAKLREKNAAAQPAVPDALFRHAPEHPQYIQGWNDCRAEMLKGMK